MCVHSWSQAICADCVVISGFVACGANLGRFVFDEAEAFAMALAAELAQYADDLPPPLVTSFSRPFLSAFRLKAPVARLGLLDEPLPADWQDYCDALAIEAVHLDYTRTSPDEVAMVRETGRDVRFYTVNEPAAVAAHFDAGLTAVISDFPERFF